MSKSGDQKKEPGTYDKGHIVFIIFLYFGITSLLPFNAFITPLGFYNTFYGYNDSFTTYISFCYNLPAIFMSIIMVAWGRKWPLIPRVIVSLSVFLVSLLIIPFIHLMFGITEEMVSQGTVENGTANDAVTLIFMLLTGVANGIFLPTIIQISTLFGSVYPQAIMEGNGIGGVIPVIINIITLLCVDDTQTVAEIYFIVAAVFVLFTFVLYFLLYRVSFSRIIIQREAPIKCCSRYTQLPALKNNEVGPSLMGTIDGDLNVHNSGNLNSTSPVDDRAIETINDSGRGKSATGSTVSTGIQDEPSSSCCMKPSENADFNTKFSKRSTKTIFKILLLPELGICLIFLVTLALFPVTTTAMGFNEDIASDWKSVIIVGTFNLIDWLGRSLPKYKFINQRKWASSPKLLFIYSLCRLVFIPLIVVPAVECFTSTAYTVIMNILFAFTNGFISSMAMMKGPFLVENEIERQIGGTLMTVMANLGLTLGSTANIAFSSLPLRQS